jgi:hypothetical protein
VIGIQSGPPGRWVHSGFRVGCGGQVGDAGSGDNREDPSGVFRSEEANQDDLPRVSGVAEAHRHEIVLPARQTGTPQRQPLFGVAFGAFARPGRSAQATRARKGIAGTWTPLAPVQQRHAGSQALALRDAQPMIGDVVAGAFGPMRHWDIHARPLGRARHAPWR